jgi:hypothetical protein
MKKHLLYVSLILISALAEAQVTPRNFCKYIFFIKLEIKVQSKFSEFQRKKD